MSDLLAVEKKVRPTTVTVLVEPRLRDQLFRAARAHERSVGAEVRYALHWYFTERVDVDEREAA